MYVLLTGITINTACNISFFLQFIYKIFPDLVEV